MKRTKQGQEYTEILKSGILVKKKKKKKNNGKLFYVT